MKSVDGLLCSHDWRPQRLLEKLPMPFLVRRGLLRLVVGRRQVIRGLLVWALLVLRCQLLIVNMLLPLCEFQPVVLHLFVPRRRRWQSRRLDLVRRAAQPVESGYLEGPPGRGFQAEAWQLCCRRGPPQLIR